MLRIGYVYVPIASKKNLQIGLEHTIWGWRSSALDRAGAREELRRLRVGDYLILGYHGPDPRTKDPDLWVSGTLKRVLVARITRPLYADATPMWPDDDYPERVDLDFLLDEEAVPGEVLGAEAVEKLRLSANKQGVALVGEDAGVLDRLGEVPPAALPDLDEDPDDDRVLDLDGSLDGYARTLVRKEQKKLRRMQCGKTKVLSCDLCGRAFPRRMVRTAHIKKRSKCTPDEQRSFKNIMLACTAGCDEMFEHGYVYVDHRGVICASPRSLETDDLDAMAKTLSGYSCAGYDGKQAFFRWHRENVAAVSGS